MATNDTRTEPDRYQQLEIENGDVVIYDADNHSAWIQSDDAVGTDAMA
jgi:phage pi2 protein 07